MKRSYILIFSVTLIAILLMLGLPGKVMAETGYVSDELIITLRTGKGPDFKIIDYLRTGDSVEMLEEDDNYLKIRTQTGMEGWVVKRYITSEPPKDMVIRQLTRRIEEMKANMGDIENIVAERDKLRDENELLKSSNEELEHDLRSIERKELIYWFLAGAGVLFLGWLIGKASRQKRFY